MKRKKRPRVQRNRPRVNATLPLGMIDRLTNYGRNTRQNKSRIIEKALDLYFAVAESTRETSPLVGDAVCLPPRLWDLVRSDR